MLGLGVGRPSLSPDLGLKAKILGLGLEAQVLGLATRDAR